MSEKDSSQSTSGFLSKKFKDLVAFFSHPLVGILGSISGVIGIPLAVTDELMKLTGVQNVDIHASFPAAQSTAAHSGDSHSKDSAFNW
jgi:hypothetical protein